MRSTVTSPAVASSPVSGATFIDDAVPFDVAPAQARKLAHGLAARVLLEVLHGRGRDDELPLGQGEAV